MRETCREDWFNAYLQSSFQMHLHFLHHRKHSTSYCCCQRQKLIDQSLTDTQSQFAVQRTDRKDYTYLFRKIVGCCFQILQKLSHCSGSGSACCFGQKRSHPLHRMPWSRQNLYLRWTSDSKDKADEENATGIYKKIISAQLQLIWRAFDYWQAILSLRLGLHCQNLALRRVRCEVPAS